MAKVDENSSNKRKKGHDENLSATSTKKSKETNEDTNRETKTNDVEEEWRDASGQAWEHYRNYLDSAAESEEGGSDTDELTELISLLKPLVSVPLSPVEMGGGVVQPYRDIRSLLPVLISMAYLHLGSHAISEAFHHAGQDNEDDGSEQQQSPEGYLSSSIQYWPENPASLSMLANYHRMNLLRSPANVCEMYAKASDCARMVRDMAISVLNLDDDAVEENLKEWVELLLLDGAVGVEYLGDDDESGSEEKEEDDDNDKRDNKEKDIPKPKGELSQTSGMISDNNDAKEKKDSDEAINKEEDCFSPSEVEATSSFMAALISSTLGWHDKALGHLKKFGFTHRVHPNVWEAACGRQDNIKENSLEVDKNGVEILFQPKRFSSKSDENGNSMGGALPPALYQRLCHIFSPSSTYWKESSYDNRGYYSYFIDLNDDVKKSPNNIIEDVIVNHLLPIVEGALPSDNGNKAIVGAEWWVHTRPIRANLGHQLHFDTDEAILAQEGLVTHPISSSVLYLTGDDNDCSSKKHPAGSTIVLNQTPDSKDVATKAWISHAKDNSYMIFPGNLLHGVLPCPGRQNQIEAEEENKSNGLGQIPLESQLHRLTFMVGFWTRRVPDKMKQRALYGPCGMLPPATDEHTWVREIAKGYEKKGRFEGSSRMPTTCVELPRVSPAWEYTGGDDKRQENGDTPKNQSDAQGQNTMSYLCPPKSLDHRFFVHNAPQCFNDSLFDKEECF